MKEAAITIALLLAAFPAAAATPAHGPEALRNLAVAPTVKVEIGYKFIVRDGLNIFIEDKDRSGDIQRLQSALREHPEDVQPMIELAEMFDQTSATNAANPVWQAVEKLCRKHLETTPDDGLFLIRLGEALVNLGQIPEAESDFRRAVLVSSNDWRCWAGLGHHLQGRAMTLLAPKQLLQPGPGPVPKELLDFHPPPDALQQCEAMELEASHCLDRATALAPKEPLAWVQLGFYAFSSNWVSHLVAHFKGGDQPSLDSSGAAGTFLCPIGLADLKQAEHLSQTNYTLIGATTLFALTAEHFREPGASPESLHQSVSEELLLLENLGRQSDKKLAARAATALGIVQFLMGDASSALANVREAAGDDPALDSAWEVLVAATAATGSAEDLVALCETRLEHVESTRNRLYLAKAYLRAEKPEKAAEQANAILKVEENNLAALLVLAAADLKRSDKPQFLESAGKEIHAAMALSRLLPGGDESQDRRREISLNLAIWCGLQDDPEYRKAAKPAVQTVLERDPEDQRAKDILRALE